MARYRKRPVEIEAVQLRWTQWNEVCELLGNALTAENSDGAFEIPAEEAHDTCGEEGPNYIALFVRNDRGDLIRLCHGDWISPGLTRGRFNTWHPEYFAAHFEAVTG